MLVPVELVPGWVVLEKSPVPLYQLQPLTQSDSDWVLTQAINLTSSLVMSATEQKSCGGTSSLAVDQLQFTLIVHTALSASLKQLTASVSHVATVTGWQNLLENNGPVKSVTSLVASSVGITVAACFPLLHLHSGMSQVTSSEALTHIVMIPTSSVRSFGAQKFLSGIKAVPLLQLHLTVSEAHRARVSLAMQ